VAKVEVRVAPRHKLDCSIWDGDRTSFGRGRCDCGPETPNLRKNPDRETILLALERLSRELDQFAEKLRLLLDATQRATEVHSTFAQKIAVVGPRKGRTQRNPRRKR
jgi:hypothetical protein